jgi:cation transport regulator ChaB
LEKQTKAAVQQALDDADSQAVIYQENTALARVSEARQLNITPGRLNLIQRLAELAPETDVNDYLTTQISDIMKQIIELQKEQREQDRKTAESERAAKKEAKESIRESRASDRNDETAITQTAEVTEGADQDLAHLPEQVDDALTSTYNRIEDALNQAQENGAGGNGKSNKP